MIAGYVICVWLFLHVGAPWWIWVLFVVSTLEAVLEGLWSA